ncbi:MAG: 4-(cytidine 5'-diphospho)-2-C-methyl-D-erythritol kinase [Deltaproteobacteria bacterium]|nr:4-(cytidine 5'-diphospho)-2-C-methyl-D-erythritol kinase [Deltaproteobacteria bacterium]
MRMLAPAKVNLYLRITGRRADGYHLLDSVMVPVSLCDEIEVTTENHIERAIESRIRISCDDPALPTDETNLAYKAAALFCQEAGIVTEIAIILRKRIPFGAGLGGGSSDAATVLKSLNQMFSQRFSEQQLRALALRLGADVPFFIPCQPARVEGIGEILTSVPPLPPRWLVIVVPPFSVSTPWAYRQFDELPARRVDVVSADLQRLACGQWPPLSCLVNDLERAVVPTYPAVRDTKERLVQAGADGTLMSGSGSSVFGIFSRKERAEQAVVALQEHGKTFMVTPLAESPLMGG